MVIYSSENKKNCDTLARVKINKKLIFYCFLSRYRIIAHR